jgi:anthranilate phosphoribosyltransferase
VNAPALSQALKAIARGDELGSDLLEPAFDALFTGAAAPEEIGALLMGLAVRGETAAELVAGARIMRRHARQVRIDGPLLDTCGTGGLPWISLNTSTASALVIAACDGRVAKHGNRSVPPKVGTADVLERLGVTIDVDESTLRACIEGCGVGFMFARSHHSAMKHVAPVRTKLGIRTIFNLLGPLTNPAGAQYQVLGVFARQWVRPMAEALLQLGTARAWVVHGEDGIDEISISGRTIVCEVSNGSVREFALEPNDAGLPAHPLSMIEGADVTGNAQAMLDLLDGDEGPFRDMVLLNAAAGLHVLGLAHDLKTGAAMAAEAIDSGKARETLRQLASISAGEAP